MKVDITVFLYFPIFFKGKYIKTTPSTTEIEAIQKNIIYLLAGHSLKNNSHDKFGLQRMTRNTSITNVIAIVLMTPRSESYMRGNKCIVIEESSNFCCPQVEGGEETISDHNRNKACYLC